jgi:hypothetical protein
MSVRAGLALIVAMIGASAAIASDFNPSRYPFTPHLTIDEEPAACAPFLKAVQREFFADGAVRYGFDIDVTDRDWPDVQVRWLFPKNDTEAGFGERDARLSLNLHHSTVEIDLDGDGAAEALTLAAWVHSWRGYNYSLFRHPDMKTFLKVLAKAKSFEDLAVGSTSALEGATMSGGGRGADAWRWQRPAVIALHGRVYLVDLGEVYERNPFVSLRRISAKGPMVETCRVQKWRSMDVAPADGAFRRYLALLDQIVGEEGSCGGTLHAHSRLQLMQPTVEALAITRPWALRDAYNTRAIAGDALKVWRNDGLWNYRKYRELPTLELAALRDLARDYRRSFGVSAASARHEARRVLDLLMRRRFVFAHTPFVPEDPAADPRYQTEQLRALILAGGPGRRIDAMLADGVLTQVADDYYGSSLCWSDGEPLLFSALEHPSIMRKLIAAGASADVRTSFGKTLLMAAAHYDLEPAARFLLANGADVNARVEESAPTPLRITGRTALHYAAENASVDMIRLLLDAGADPTAVDSAKRDVLDYLSRNTLLTAREKARVTRMFNEEKR